MTSAWETFQEMIKVEMRKVYSETVVEHAMNPRNLGDVEDADGYSRVTGPCGDTMTMWLRLKDDTIAEATFITDGCSTTIAAGSIVTELAKGKTVVQAKKISQQDILSALDGLPEENKHCALLAANTLKGAIRNSLVLKKEPWKRAYKRR